MASARQRLQSSLGASSSSLTTQNQLFAANAAEFQMPPHTGGQIPWSENIGFPPISPYSQIPANRLVDHQVGLPPLIPTHYRDAASMEERDGGGASAFIKPRGVESLPHKAHRRSVSDIPLGFSCTMQSPPPLVCQNRESSLERGEGMGERKSEGEVVDDLFSAYMNLDNIGALNCDDKVGGKDNREDLDSRGSGTKTNESSDNEATSCVNESGSKRNDVTPRSRHCRSVSMDNFIGKLNEKEAFSMEFGNGEFTGAELKKIVGNKKLAEMACNDPKRVKRILANRQSAARSKERKLRYIAELEHKVQTLQTEATTLSAQLTLLQRDSAGLANQNNELKFRLQSMEQQAQLRDALNEALSCEIQRLKLATNGDATKFHQLSQPYHHQQQQQPQSQ
ncbi:hypothetical protein M569_02371 [Genlisea aurea]|uniref:BZIP domain-containing protein n=1 Tax=Genlisea aurea TaxID=192259 RepID=S8CYB1_9LAMI|nr:hypothetical protein M569_02371 [Genlisea aurea]